MPIVAPPETVHLAELLATLRERAGAIESDTSAAAVRPFVQGVQALCFAAGELELKEVRCMGWTEGRDGGATCCVVFANGKAS